MHPHNYTCLHCGRVVSVHPATPVEAIADTLLVRELYREVEPSDAMEAMLAALNNGIYVEHPLVCSDTCYGALLRTKPDGWEITPVEERRS